MTISEDDAIERAKLREVAAIFHSDEALEAAAEALLLAGFDRADLDRLADLDEVRERVGLIYVVPQAPRRPLVTREDVTRRWYCRERTCLARRCVRCPHRGCSRWRDRGGRRSSIAVSACCRWYQRVYNGSRLAANAIRGLETSYGGARTDTLGPSPFAR